MSAQPSVLQVVILRDGLLVGTEVFIPGTYVIGSGRGADLRLDDPSAIAEHHATLYFLNGKAAIQDAAAAAGIPSKGVWVNGHRIKACEVRPVDEIACGAFVLKARVLSQKAAAGTALPPEVANLLRATPGAGAPIAALAPLAPLAPIAPQAAAPIKAPPPGTAPSARRMAEQQRVATPAQSAPTKPINGMINGMTPPRARNGVDRSVQAVAEFFSEEHPTAPNPVANVTAVAPRAAQAALAQQSAREPMSGPFIAARALSAEGELVMGGVTVPGAQATPAGHPQPALLRPPARGADAPTIGVQLPFDGPPEWDAPASASVEGASAAPSVIPSKSVVNFEWPAAPPEMEESQPAYQLESPIALSGAEAGARVEAIDALISAPPPPLHDAPEVVAQRAAQAKAAAPVATAAPAAPAAKVKLAPPGKGAPRLYFELFWSGARHAAFSFTPSQKKPVVAGARDSADVPLYGFGLDADFVIGEQHEKGGYKLFIPAGARVERGKLGYPLAPVAPNAIEGEAPRRFLSVNSGDSVRLTTGGATSLLAYVAPPAEVPRGRFLASTPVLWLIALLLVGSGFGSFLYYAPSAALEAEFAPKEVPQMAVKLIAPEPHKKERVQKKLAEMKAEREKLREKSPEKKVVEPKQPTAVAQNKALQAIKKLTTLPATADILNAVDKAGNGPGSKKAKGAYQLTGLLGKGVAAPGMGAYGLGGGGIGKGKGTFGGELLRGKAGIGALGIGNVGKGSVGGTVARATGRAIGASGSIDREAVAKVVNDHLGEVSACYERALLTTPGLAGKVVLEWSIGMAGSVTAVKSKSSTLRSSSVEGCIMNALKKWKFPSPKGGQVIITYPFLFNSVGF